LELDDQRKMAPGPVKTVEKATVKGRGPSAEITNPT